MLQPEVDTVLQTWGGGSLGWGEEDLDRCPPSARPAAP